MVISNGPRHTKDTIISVDDLFPVSYFVQSVIYVVINIFHRRFVF